MTLIASSERVFTNADLPHPFLQDGMLRSKKGLRGSGRFIKEEIAEIELVAVGDVMLGGSLIPKIREKGLDYPFREVKEIIKSADVTICNLEAPFGTKGEPFPKKFNFLVPPPFISSLADAGFDVVTLANNHIMDYGAGPLQETISLLGEKGIRHTGAGFNLQETRRPVIINSKGIKIAFLAYSKVFPREFYVTDEKPGTAPGEERYLREDVQKAKEIADVVVVTFHWGDEYKRELKAYQRYLGQLAIDRGADLVLGCHPHVLQSIEKYRQGIICYSLGNFAFGSHNEKGEGAIFKFKISKPGVKGMEIIPIKPGHQPVLLSGNQAGAVQNPPLSNSGGISLWLELLKP